ncbi:Methyl-accepting chemotaxis protein signaling domain protein [Leptospira borgpetersenii str. 4E]|nr:Methyl-accepting chemotaxis protein signaling domain protein [Leptospira borgpetersenii str. 4E]
MSKQSIESIRKKGETLTYYARMGIMIMMLLSLASSFKALQTQIRVIHTCGALIMFIYSILGFILYKKYEIKHWVHNLFVILDSLTLSVTIFLDSMVSAEIIAPVLKNAILYSVYYFIIAYSGLLGRPKFVLITGLISSIGYAIALTNVSCFIWIPFFLSRSFIESSRRCSGRFKGSQFRKLRIPSSS